MLFVSRCVEYLHEHNHRDGAPGAAGLDYETHSCPKPVQAHQGSCGLAEGDARRCQIAGPRLTDESFARQQYPDLRDNCRELPCLRHCFGKRGKLPDFTFATEAVDRPQTLHFQRSLPWRMASRKARAATGSCASMTPPSSSPR